MSNATRPAARPNRHAAQDTPNRPRPVTPILIVNSVIAGAVLTLTFDGPVSVNGLPGFTTDLPGQHVVAAAQTSATVVALTFNESIVGVTTLNVGFRDPAIRNASGGYVTSTTFIL